MNLRRFLLLAVLALGVGFSSAGYAANMAREAVSDLQKSFREQTEKWFDPVKKAAQWLLLSLALFAFMWTGIQMVLKNADFQEILVELVRMIMTVGFFLAVIMHADTWSIALINGFMWLGNQTVGATQTLGAGSLDAAGILGRGFGLAGEIIKVKTGINLATALILGLLALIAFIIYAAIAAYCLLAMAEAYIVTAAGVIFLGFGSSSWTSDYARRYITYCVSIGAKLYALFLVVGIGEQLIHNWAIGEDKSAVMSSISIVGVLFMLLLLVKMIPDVVQGLINGVSLGSGTPSIGGMLAAAAGGAAVAGGAAIAGTAAVQQAYKLAGMQGAAALGNAAASALGGGNLHQTGSMIGAAKDSLATLGRTGSNLAKAAAGSLGAKILANAAAAQSLQAERIQGSMSAPKASAGAAGSSAAGTAIPTVSMDPFEFGSAHQAYEQMSAGYLPSQEPGGSSTGSF